MRNAVPNAVRSPFQALGWNAVPNAVPDSVPNAVPNAVRSAVEVEVEGEREETLRLLHFGRYRAHARIRRGLHAAAAVGSRHG